MGPFSAGFCRYAIASACLLAILAPMQRSWPKLTLKQIAWILLLGSSGIFAYTVCFLWGLKTISAGRAALIIALNPVAISLGSALVFREPFTRLKLLGIATSVCGAAIVISRGNPLTLLSGGLGQGDLLLLGCVISWMIYSLIGKQVMKEISSLTATAYAFVAGTVLLGIPAWQEGFRRNVMAAEPQAWLSVIYLGLFGSAIAFVWYYQGLQKIGPSKASIFINLVPPSAIILAALLLQEPITSSLIWGGILVISGILCTNRG
jgi:drug/metabolite transporter (DMT)-like permease